MKKDAFIKCEKCNERIPKMLKKAHDLTCQGTHDKRFTFKNIGNR